MTKTLLIIDIQNDYFPGGAVELQHAEDAARRAAELLTAFRERGVPVVHVRHEMPEAAGLPFLRPGTRGAEINSQVAPLEGEPVIVKHFPGAFTGTPLLDTLKQHGTTELVICGMMTQMCVSATARAAMELGFTTTVVTDATATRDHETQGRSVPAETMQLAHLAALEAGVARLATAAAAAAELS